LREYIRSERMGAERTRECILIFIESVAIERIQGVANRIEISSMGPPSLFIPELSWSVSFVVAVVSSS